jgi:1-acyl-sn-glycerol-3-phosphate acyltransferase
MNNIFLKIYGYFFWSLEFTNCFFNYCLFPYIRYRLNLIEKDEILNGPDIKRYFKASASIFGIKWKLLNPYNIDLTKQYIFIANHSSWFDQPTLKMVANNQCHFLAKEDYSKIPILGQGLKIHQTIFVGRNNKEKVHELFLEYLKKGHSVCLYPEGTRTIGDQILPFRIGAFKYASLLNIKIIPVFIENTHLIYKKTDPLWKIRRGINVNVHIGNPIAVELDKEDQVKLSIEKKYRDFFNNPQKNNWY